MERSNMLNTHWLIVGVMPLLLAGGEAQWREYTPPDLSFKVQLPSAPRVSKVQQDGQDVLAIASDFDEPNGPTVALLVLDLPTEVRRIEEAREALKGLEEGFTGRAKARKLDSKEIELSGILGREMTVDGVLGKKARVRYYVTGKKVYQIMILGDDLPALTSLEVSKVLDSFQILALPSQPLNPGGSDNRLARWLGEKTVDVAIICGIVGFIFFVSKKSRNSRTRRLGNTESSDQSYSS
jgi:hypothetical protein